MLLLGPILRPKGLNESCEEFDKGSELRLKSEALYLLDTLTFNSTLNPKPPFVVTGLKKPF